MANKKKKQDIDRLVKYHQAQESDDSVPESNIINLREVMLQREVERLRRELEKRQRATGLGRVKYMFSSGQTRAKKKAVPKEIEPPTLMETQIPKQSERRAAPALRIKFSRSKLNFKKAYVKSILSFIVVCVILLVPIFGFWGYQYLVEMRSRIIDISMQAFDQLVLAGQAATESDYVIAQEKFSEASDTFILAQKELDKIGGTLFNVLKYVPFKGQVLTSGQNLLEAGQSIALAGQEITELIKIFNPGIGQSDEFLSQNNITDLLLASSTQLVPAEKYISQAVKNLEKVDANILPAEYRDSLGSIKENLPVIEEDFKRFNIFSDLFYKILGGESSRRYLMIFQNNHEMRATGGFIGSLALVDIDRGNITRLEVPGGGPYDFQGQLKEQVISPSPLHLVNPHWYLQDANWFPDFPTSAKKIMWFYEKSGGPTVDGVISLTPDIIIDLLKIIGSIDLQATYGVTINSENFIKETLNQVENEYDKDANKPKQFIADLMPQILQYVFESDQNQFLTIVGALSDALLDRQLLFYLSDQEVQGQISQLDWGGEIKKTSGDYLMIVNSNIAGGKTDGVIDQSIKHQVSIAADGEATTTVEITRLHNGIVGEQFTGVKNIDFMRLYVPYGSELIEASGFEQPDPKLIKWPEQQYQDDSDLAAIEGAAIIDERTNTRINNEFGKTVFGNWVQVEPGESVTVKFIYKLPFKISADKLINASVPYSLLVQKQAGSFDSIFHSSLAYPDYYRAVWQWPDESELSRTDHAFNLEKILGRDIYYSIVFEK